MGEISATKHYFSVANPLPSGIDPLNFFFENFGKFIFSFLHFHFSLAFLGSCLLCYQWQIGMCGYLSHYGTAVGDFSQWQHRRWSCWLMWGSQCPHLPPGRLCLCHLVTFSSNELKIFTKWFFLFSFFIYFSRFPSSEFVMSS